MANFNGWDIGHRLSEVEIDEIINESGFKPVFGIAPQPAPGVFFSAPEGYVGIFSIDSLDFFQVEEETDEGYAGVTYLGNDLALEEVLDLAVLFITDMHLQAQAAIHFQFDLDKFENPGVMVESLPEMIHLDCSWFPGNTEALINDRLLETDPYYLKLVTFLNNPQDEAFAELRQEVEKYGQFSSIY